MVINNGEDDKDEEVPEIINRTGDISEAEDEASGDEIWSQVVVFS